MQAIITKFIPCTETKPSRIKATCSAGSVTMSYHSIDADDNEQCHRAVAFALIEKLGWDKGDVITGQLPDQSFVHVFTKAITAIRGIREMVRKGEQSGNPWAKPAFVRAFEVLADYDRVPFSEV